MDPYKHRPSSAFNAPYWTTNSGAPISNNNHSLTIGQRGPILCVLRARARRRSSSPPPPRRRHAACRTPGRRRRRHRRRSAARS